MTDFSKIDFDKVVETRNIDLFHNNVFQIHWIPGRYCNYNCSYCWPDSHSLKRDEYRDESFFMKAIENVVNVGKQRGFKNNRLTLAGGEPTVHPHFLAIVEKYGSLREVNSVSNLIIVTNLSRSYAWFKKFVDVCSNLNSVSVVASWHREFANIDEFAEKSLFLQENNINVDINVTFAVHHFQKYYEESLYLQNKGLTVKALPQRFTNNREYTEEELNILKTEFKYSSDRKPKLINPYPETYISTDKINKDRFTMELVNEDGSKQYVDYAERYPSLGFKNFNNWSCYSGFQNLCIDEFGDLRRGKAGCSDIVIGNIFTGPYGYDSPEPCPMELCDAATDSVTRKIKLCYNKS